MHTKRTQSALGSLVADVKRTYSEQEAAGFLNLSVSSLRKSRMNRQRDRHLPLIPYVRLGRRVLYLREDLESALAANRVEGAIGHD